MLNEDFLFNGETSCTPPLGTEVFDMATYFKPKGSEGCTGSYSLFQIPTMTEQIKTFTRSHSLVSEDEYNTCFSENGCSIIPYSNNTQEDLSKSTYASEEKLQSELLELITKFTEIKYRLFITESMNEDLKNELIGKNSYINSIKKYKMSIKENINDLTSKMKIERSYKQKYTELLQTEIKTLKEKLHNALMEKSDLESVLKDMQSAFIIMNDKYTLLEKEVNELKKEANLKIEDEKNTIDVYVNDLENMAKYSKKFLNEIKILFTTMEDDINFLKTELASDIETFVEKMTNSTEKDVKVIEENIFKRLHTFYIFFAKSIKSFPEDVNKMFEQCNSLCDMLLKSELENTDLQTQISKYTNKINEIQHENQQLKSDQNKVNTRLRNFEITSKSLHDAIKAVSGRLYESEEEIDRLNKVISDNKTNEKMCDKIPQNFEDSQNNCENISKLTCDDDKYKDIYCCLLNVKNIIEDLPKLILGQRYSEKTLDNSERNNENTEDREIDNISKQEDFYYKIEGLLGFVETANNILSCVQAKHEALKLELSDTTECNKKLKEQKVERDNKLSEFSAKLLDQKDMLTRQSKTIESLHDMLIHQNDDAVRMHELQADRPEETFIHFLEEKLALKDKECAELKCSLKEQVDLYNSLMEKNKNQQDKEVQERNFIAEIDNLKSIVKTCERERENLQKSFIKNKEDYDKVKKSKRVGSPRTFHTRRTALTTSPQKQY
uniref:Uncharacterized protein n=1 Tax=Clastoptera arizonana TaxID=38151 RepID=A0A1B6DKC7_9HEMI